MGKITIANTFYCDGFKTFESEFGMLGLYFDYVIFENALLLTKIY